MKLLITLFAISTIISILLGNGNTNSPNFTTPHPSNNPPTQPLYLNPMHTSFGELICLSLRRLSHKLDEQANKIDAQTNELATLTQMTKEAVATSKKQLAMVSALIKNQSLVTKIEKPPFVKTWRHSLNRFIFGAGRRIVTTGAALGGLGLCAIYSFTHLLPTRPFPMFSFCHKNVNL